MKKKNEAMAIAFTRRRMTTASALVREDRVMPTLRHHRERCCPRMKVGSGRIRSCK